MLGNWLPKSDGENFYSKPEYKMLIQGSNKFFFVHFRMFIFLPNEFQISLTSFMSVNFAVHKYSLK